MIVLGDGVPDGTTVLSNDAVTINATANAAAFVTGVANAVTTSTVVVLADTTGITTGMRVSGVRVFRQMLR